MNHTVLCEALAIRLFRWAFSPEWAALLPPGWPAKADNLNRIEEEVVIVALREGLDLDWNLCPYVPDYAGDPMATGRVWAWLEAQTTLQDVTFHYCPQRRALRQHGNVCCTIRLLGEPACAALGESAPEAFCRAVLMVADVLKPQEAL
jgi:hypothetical protein